jgi:hypothetical protein
MKGRHVRRSLETFAVLVVVATVLVVGCSGGFGPTLPSPDGTPHNDAPINDTPVNDTPTNDTPVNDTPVNDTPVNDTPINDIAECPEDADLEGIVRVPAEMVMSAPAGGVGAPVAGALVAVTDGEKVLQTLTDENGEWCLDGVNVGDYVVAYGLSGFETDYVIGSFAGTPQDGLRWTMSTPTTDNPTECPVIEASFDEPVDGDANLILGSATNTDTDGFAFFQGDTARPWTFQDAVDGDPIGPVRPIRIPTVAGEADDGYRVFVANAVCGVLSAPVEGPVER